MLYLLQVYFLVTVIVGVVTVLTHVMLALAVILCHVIRRSVQFLNQVAARTDAAVKASFSISYEGPEDSDCRTQH